MENLAWFLLLLPLLSAMTFHFFLKEKNDLVGLIASANAAISWVITLVLVISQREIVSSFSWLQLESFDFNLGFGFSLDRLAKGLLFVVSTISLLVHVFSLIYMAKDTAKTRFFTNLSFFIFSMVGLVFSPHFIQLFIFWELVGLSSYLLIGHWYQKDSAADAAKKALIINRIGDFGLMIGILLLWQITGTFTFANMESLSLNHWTPLALILIFCGVAGKSAQFPLHVWLPDAMEGPTPISALIHAATMVAAGIYLLVRLQVSLGADLFANWAGHTISYIGITTALIAALIALKQDDIKKILAFSTLSQLGYMVMAAGLGAGGAAFFHLYTHAWFKALLFLGAGAIIYACHHQQNIWKMGGLWQRMPLTSRSFLIGTAALMALPVFTSGFYSKEQILEAAHHSPLLYILALVVAGLTPFYMTRLCLVVFSGKPRSEDANHATDPPLLMLVPLGILGILSVISGWSWIARHWVPLYHVSHPDLSIFFSSIGVSLAGTLLAFFLYYKKDRDPIKAPYLEKQLFIDNFYEKKLVGTYQRFFASSIHFLDEVIINLCLVSGSSKFFAQIGIWLKQLQNGKLSHYLAFFTAGTLLLIYLILFLII